MNVVDMKPLNRLENAVFVEGHELANVLQPRGVAVAVEAVHMCMMIRGVQKAGARMVTQTLLGEFADNPELKRDLEALMGPLGEAKLL